jgi:5'-methylthioadenosine nucleosidase
MSAMAVEVDSDRVIQHVLVLIAMEAEAQPLLTALSLSTVAPAIPNAPFQIFQGAYKGTTVSVITNGKDKRFGVDNVGTTPAALATFLGIAQLKPDLVINAG